MAAQEVVDLFVGVRNPGVSQKRSNGHCRGRGAVAPIGRISLLFAGRRILRQLDQKWTRASGLNCQGLGKARPGEHRDS